MLFKRTADFEPDRFIRKARRFPPFELRRYDPAADWLRTMPSLRPGPLGLRLIAIGDTHGDLAHCPDQRRALHTFVEQVGNYDLCILLGDITPADIRAIIQCIPTDRIIGILGNHDAPDTLTRFGLPDLTQGGSWSLGGVTFGCIGGSFRYKDEDFPSHTQYQSLVLAQHLPSPVHVLLTHDRLFDRADVENTAHVGLMGITYAVYRLGIPYHIHAHLHRSCSGVYSNGTRYRCVYRWELAEL